MRFFFWLFLLTALGSSLSEYSFGFPTVPQNAVYLSCKPFDTPVSLTTLASTSGGFEKSTLLAQDALSALATARQIAQSQASPWFYAGSNVFGYFELSHQCYHQGQSALSLAIQSVATAAENLDRQVSQWQELGIDSEFSDGLVDDWRESKKHIETGDASAASLGGVFVRSLNLTKKAVKSPLLLNAALKQLLDREGLLEVIFKESKRFSQSEESAKRLFVELSDEFQEAYREASRLHAQLSSDQVYLIPENAFALQLTMFADSTLSYRFPDRFVKASNWLDDSFDDQKKAQLLSKSKASGDFGRAMNAQEKAAKYAKESKALFESVQHEAQELERNLVQKLALQKITAKNPEVAKRLDAPLPSVFGQRVVELAERVRLFQKQPSDENVGAWLVLWQFITAAEKDGLDVTEEKAKAQSFRGRDGGEDVATLRESVLAKARDRFGYLEGVFSNLLPYRDIVSLPEGVFNEERLNYAALGQLRAAEKQLKTATSQVSQKAQDAVRDALLSSQYLVVATGPVRMDEPVVESIVLRLKNSLSFGADNVVITLPKVLEGAVLEKSPGGIVLHETELHFVRVEPRKEYELELSKSRVMVRRLASVDEEVYTTLEKSRRRLDVSFFSEEAGDVLIEEKLPAEPRDAFSTHAFWYDGTLKARVLAQKGANHFVLEYSIAKPVAFRKIPMNSSVSYVFQNQLPIALTRLNIEFLESFDCAPFSSEYFRPLGGKAYAFEKAFPLAPFEEKTVYIALSCPPSATLPFVASPAPVSSSLYLQQVAHWATFSPESTEWLRQAQDAFARNDATRLAEATRHLDTLADSFAQSLEAKAKSLCGRCSSGVRAAVQEALSAAYLREFSRADELLLEANQLQAAEANAALQAAQNQTVAEKTIRELSIPEFEAFQTAYSTTSSRKSPRFESAEQAYKAVAKRYERLREGQVPTDRVSTELTLLSEDRQRLSSQLDSVKKDASNSLTLVRQAQQQFGDAATALSLSSAEAAYESGQFAEADEQAKRLARSLQTATPVPQTGLVASNASLVPVFFGTLAVVALGALVYYFRFYKKPGAPFTEDL